MQNIVQWLIVQPLPCLRVKPYVYHIQRTIYSRWCRKIVDFYFVLVCLSYKHIFTGNRHSKPTNVDKQIFNLRYPKCNWTLDEYILPTTSTSTGSSTVKYYYFVWTRIGCYLNLWTEFSRSMENNEKLIIFRSNSGNNQTRQDFIFLLRECNLNNQQPKCLLKYWIHCYNNATKDMIWLNACPENQ